MSSKSTPVLCGSIPLFELFMSKWKKLAKENKHLVEFIQPGLDMVYKYYDRMDYTSTYIIMMCKCFCLPDPDN